ncbi:MAG: Wzz/FepE/Etk N-terminal domain-containing protein, partial [Steroidobacteraceae bacterium]
MSTNDDPSTLGDYINVLRRRRWYLLTIIPAAILLAVYVAYTLPAIYRSSATILLEPSSMPQELVATETAVTNYADSQIELVQRRVLTADNLVPVVSKIDPYPDMPGLSAREKANQVIENTMIERVDPITLEVLPESSAFSIHYQNANPEVAAAIAQQIADLFLT